MNKKASNFNPINTLQDDDLIPIVRLSELDPALRNAIITGANLKSQIQYEQVDTFALLGDPTTQAGVIKYVRNATGIYWINRHENGFYFSNGTAWKTTDLPSYFADINFRVYNNADNSKFLALNLNGLTTATTRTLTPQDKDYTIGDQADDLTASEKSELTGGGSTTLHTHNAINIIDFQLQVSANTDVIASVNHITSDGTDHTFINQDIRSSASPTFQNLTVPGNVDGRDVSVDGSKLDTIENGAEVNNISDPDASALTGGGSIALHTHDASNIIDLQLAISGNVDVVASVAHITSDGSSHTFINQDVTTGGSPTFAGLSVTGAIAAEGGNSVCPTYIGEMSGVSNQVINVAETKMVWDTLEGFSQNGTEYTLDTVNNEIVFSNGDGNKVYEIEIKACIDPIDTTGAARTRVLIIPYFGNAGGEVAQPKDIGQTYMREQANPNASGTMIYTKFRVQPAAGQVAFANIQKNQTTTCQYNNRTIAVKRLW
jgi:hypothetical protein